MLFVVFWCSHFKFLVGIEVQMTFSLPFIQAQRTTKIAIVLRHVQHGRFCRQICDYQFGLQD